MDQLRRRIVALLLAFLVIGVPQAHTQQNANSSEVRLERLPAADLGNGHFRNPILVGPGADNTVLRVGQDYYMAAGGGWPDQLIWHSRDLINWIPLTRVLRTFSGRAWASDLTYYQGKYYLYTTLVDLKKGRVGPLNFAQRSLLGGPTKDEGDKAWDNVVMWATNPGGPWSEPIHLGVFGLFDPGHVVDRAGNRYLYFNKGYMIRLSPDGLSTIGDLKKVYDGWDYPQDWVVECKCLEAPKITYHDGNYYLLSAEGGTAGPSTAHMVIVARSRTVEGPWENSPYNPLIHTVDNDDLWSRQGHGTLVEDTNGAWWVQYTGYERGYEVFGKQTIMLPIVWTADGWPQVPLNADPTKVLDSPPGEDLGNGMPLSDHFDSTTLGIQWQYTPEEIPGRDFRVGNGKAVLVAAGKIPGDEAILPAGATVLSVIPVNHSWEVEVKVTVPPGAEGGVLLDGNLFGDRTWADLALRDGQAIATWAGQANYLPYSGRQIYLRMRNIKYDIACFYSFDGKSWKQFPNATRVSDGRRISLYAAGQGEVVFQDFKYSGLD
jgi:beta-xylosidase